MKPGIFTTSRADFGILEALLRKLEQQEIEYCLFAGGMHFKHDLGFSLSDIKGYNIDDTFDFFLNEDTPSAKVNSMGIEFFQLSKIMDCNDFDCVILLGDRFELIPIVTTAILFNKPIIHLHGGEITEGALDEQIRHMITKASHLHFASCKEYAKNIIKIGEESWRVHNVGALGIDNIKNICFINKKDLFENLGINNSSKICLCTYHPVTIESLITVKEQLNNLFEALEIFSGEIIITAPNLDQSYQIIQSMIAEFSKIENVSYIKHFGMRRYLSLIPHCEFVLGNSSSGIIEVPYFKIPTINIGNRQKGRTRHKSIIDVDYSVDSIKKGIIKAMDPEFKNSLKKMEYKFGDGHTAEKIVGILKKIKFNERLLRKKLVFPGDNYDK